MKKKILILSNDKLYLKNNIISSEYNDTINIIESLAKNYSLKFICRSSQIIKNFVIKKKNYKTFSIIKIGKLKEVYNYSIFMISITPFNFINFMILKFYNPKITGYVYLRSDGHKEYYHKFGYLGVFIYNLIFKIVTSRLKVLSVSNKITGLKKKYKLINPSEIENKWFKNRKKPNLDKPRLLYIGRFKKEKGIFSLIEIINSIKIDLRLNVVGVKNKILIDDKRVKFTNEVNSTKKLINFYDLCNIFVLPSFTEGSPKVLLESLSRLRPVIIFNEIKHVKQNFKGIFLCRRNPKDFNKKIDHILNNYNKIIKQLKKNKLHTKKEFQNDLRKIIK